MKRSKLITTGAALIAAAGFATATVAETVTETTTTTSSSGTVSSLTSGALIVKPETGPAPLSYTYSKTTTYVDEDGNPVSLETVRSGSPVTVYYTTSPDGLVASKVVVKKTVTGDPLHRKTTIEEKRTTVTP